MANTGDRLRAWRERQKPKMSQQAAATKIGATQSAWASWETGESIPEIDYAREIEVLTKRQVKMTDWAESRRVKRVEDKQKAEAARLAKAS